MLDAMEAFPLNRQVEVRTGEAETHFACLRSFVPSGVLAFPAFAHMHHLGQGPAELGATQRHRMMDWEGLCGGKSGQPSP